MPRVSVIIPTYNGKTHFLDQSLASVEAQTFQDFELILVDDASTDGTLHYDQKFIPDHCQVLYSQRETNGGPSVARNDGGKRATGEFLAFLDQDDLWEPTFLEATVALLQTMKEDVAFIHTDRYLIDINNVILNSRNTRNSSHNHLARLLMGGSLKNATIGLFRKTAFDAVQGFDENLRWNEDTDLGIRISRRYGIVNLPKPFYRVRRAPHSAAKRASPQQLFGSRTHFLRKHAPSCQQSFRLQKALRHEWSYLFSDMGKYYSSKRQHTDAAGCFRKSLRLRPFSRKTWLRYLRSFLP